MKVMNMNTALEKTRKKKKVNELSILYDIYRLRTLTSEQVRNVHFSHSKQYHYVKLKNLKKEGYLDSGPLIKTETGRKKATCYWVTDQGIDRLRDAGYVESARRAWDNKPKGHRLDDVVSVNDLYSELTPYGYEVIDSREWKERFGINRNSMVRAGLQFPNGDEYAVYMFFSKEIQNKTVETLMKQVFEYTMTNKVIILAKHTETYEKIKRAMKPKYMVRDEINLLPYDFGIELLKKLKSPGDRKVLLEKELGITSENQAELTPVTNGKASSFADYQYLAGGESLYIVDHTYHDAVKLNMIELNYTHEVYKSLGKNLVVITWKPNEKELRERFEAYPHVAVEGIMTKELKSI